MRSPGARLTVDINDRLPIVAHETLGVYCCGCLHVRVSGDRAEIVGNECGDHPERCHSRTLNVVLELAATDTICSAVCPHCRARSTRSQVYPALRASSVPEAGKAYTSADPSSEVAGSTLYTGISLVAEMANQEHLDILKEGVQRECRSEQHPDIKLTFAGRHSFT